MPFPVTINGNTYTLDNFAPFNYPTYFPNIIQDVATTAQSVQDATALIAGSAPGETTLASAATVNLGATNTTRAAITGTAAITSLGTVANRIRLVRFTGAATLTHNATSLILPGGASFTTAAGDTAIAVSDASGNWRVFGYQKANGLPVLNVGRSFRNRLRNGGFTVNQRAVSGTVTLAAGAYGHDGFKAGAGGCTYTFAKASGVTTITITNGTLVQVIEGPVYLTEGGTCTLSWLGTAQARINGGAYASSPITVTGLTPEANATVEWGTGTLALPQFELGPDVTPFEYRDDELRRAQRYYLTTYPVGSPPGTANVSSYILWVVAFTSNYNTLPPLNFPTTMRATPTITFYSAVTGAAGVGRDRGANVDVPMSNFGRVTNFGTNVQVNNASVAAQSAIEVHVAASAEL